MRGGQQQEQDKSLDLFYSVGFIAVIALGLWYTQHAAIVAIIFRFRVYQAFIFLQVLEYAQSYLSALHIMVPDLQELEVAVHYMQRADPETITIRDLMMVSNLYGSFFKYVTLGFALLAGCYMIFFNALSRFRNKYTMATFSQEESVNWSQIVPVIHKNLTEEHIREGAWAMALRPMDFCIQNKLIDQGSTKDNKSIAVLKKGLAKEVFALQMGPLWENLEKLPPYKLALFACFAAKTNGDDKGCKQLLHQIARSSATGRLDFGGTRELLMQHMRSSKVSRAVGPHAYVCTVMASLLETARLDGVLASSEFLWLKPLDRSLWFVLNCVGRQTPFCEVAGPIAHFKVEQRLRRPLKVPMVDEAVHALEAALADIIYHPDDK